LEEDVDSDLDDTAAAAVDIGFGVVMDKLADLLAMDEKDIHAKVQNQ
jgi:hypothetical protein